MPWVLALCGTLALSACGAKYAEVPARLDLKPYGRVALVAFSSEHQNGTWSALATRRFAEALLASQPGIELVELGPPDPSAGDLTASADSATLARVLGREKNVPAVFVGRLTTSGVKPRGGVGAAAGVSVHAAVSGDLTVRLLSRSGATVWRSSAAASRTVGRVAISGRVPSIAARNPEDAYGEVVRELVTDVTRDLRPTLVRR